LLNKTQWDVRSPGGGAVLGGKEIGDDIGYGPLRYLSASEVKTIADELRTITHDELVSRYDSDEMNKLEIYPGGWDMDENKQDLLTQIEVFRDFYYDAATKGESVVIMLM
jgi:hypothetical protein